MLTLAICETHTPLIAVATPTEVYRLWTEEFESAGDELHDLVCSYLPMTRKTSRFMKLRGHDLFSFPPEPGPCDRAALVPGAPSPGHSAQPREAEADQEQ